MRLIDLEQLIPAAYNPRQVDEERLSLVSLSLKKLGWLLPVYATEDMQILSGHQRSLTAKRIGYTQAPTVIMENLDDNTRKAVNILFNRSTNDMDIDAVPAELAKQLKAANLNRMAESLPDRANHFPCMSMTKEPIGPYVKANSGRWIPYANVVAKSLYSHKILMPIIVGPERKVINGIGRLQMLAEKGISHAEFVHLDQQEAEFASLMLNMLSMDFALEKKYADLLRYNSFRRIRRQRVELGNGFIFGLGFQHGTFDISKKTHQDLWKRKFGLTVLDFGAGHLTETEILRSIGVDSVPFEPYPIGRNEEIDKPKALAMAEEFIEQVASGKRFSSIFISSVLNSVPFEADRKCIVKICSALCGPWTKLYAVASATNSSGITTIFTKQLNKRQISYGKMLLHYEPGIVLGEISEKPKVQKYHDTKQFYNLFKTAFEVVKVTRSGDNVEAIAVNPKAPLMGLREALEFEFNLPYPDGSRMGLHEKALAAFEKRLNTKL